MKDIELEIMWVPGGWVAIYVHKWRFLGLKVSTPVSAFIPDINHEWKDKGSLELPDSANLWTKLFSAKIAHCDNGFDQLNRRKNRGERNI